VFGRENLIGLALLLLSGIAALGLLYELASGTRFQFTGPGWLATALQLLFLGVTIFIFARQPGRRWPWQNWRDRNRDDH
jgi:hypothetical protein